MDSAIVRAGVDLFARPRLCPGCAPDVGRAAALRPSQTLCFACCRQLSHLRPLRPRPSWRSSGLSGNGAAGMVDCVAAGPYAGALRRCIVAFKDRDRPELCAHLAPLLSRLVANISAGPTLLVPIPASGRARRSRGFCHVTRLCRAVAVSVAQVGVASVLSARAKPDFSGLGRAQRRAAAAAYIGVRAKRMAACAKWVNDAPNVTVLLVDDIVTSGATLSAAAAQMREHALMPDAAVTLAATI